MAIRDFLKKLGIGSGARGSEPRRPAPPPRAADAATIKVPAASVPPMTPPSTGSSPRGMPLGGAPTVPSAVPVIPSPKQVEAERESKTEPPPKPSSGSASGGDPNATQYISALKKKELVGVLAGIDGPLEGEVYPIGSQATRLGREGCDVTLFSKRISRYHARIVHTEGGFEIEANPEVANKNPTLVNDQRIESGALVDGDTIQLGDCTFKFRTI